MKRIPKFDSSKMQKLEGYKVENLSSIIGGWIIGTTSYSSSAGSGEDVADQGNTTDWWFDDGSSCQYIDVIATSGPYSGPLMVAPHDDPHPIGMDGTIAGIPMNWGPGPVE